MKDILTGLFLLFTVPSCIYFWKWIIEYEEETKMYEREILNDKENNKLDFWQHF